MSAYPPPPPPGQPPPIYDRRTMRSQRKYLRAQQRAMRYQLRAQRRSLQRRSIVGPLILLALGIVFLLSQLGDLSWAASIRWYGRFWPAILIAAGFILLLEWFIDRARNPTVAPARALGGGAVSLLIFLAFAGLASRSIEYGLDWSDHTFGNGYTRLDHIFGDRHEADNSITEPIASTSSLLIRNPHGDVTVSGSSSDGQIHISLHTQAYAWKNSDAERKLRSLQPTFSTSNGVLTLDINAIDGGQADLTIQLPRTTPLTVQANRGDVTINEMSAPITLSANNGDVNLSGINNSVTLHINNDDAGITLHSIHGPISIEGHSGDVDISDVSGSLTMQGDFFGSTDLQHINGPVHFITSRTQFSAARLDDQFSVDNDSLDATALLGPIVLRTADKNITLDRVQGSIDVTNSNGSIEVTAAAPLDAITIQNQRGSVDLGLPGNAGFNANAKNRNGDMENDFNLTPSGSSDAHTLSGSVNGGGPTVTVSTTDGDVTLRRSTVAPLPKLPPNPPLFTRTPASPAPPRPPSRAQTPPAPPRPPSQDGTF